MLNNLGSFLSRITAFLRNKYILAMLVFLTWMLFFDSNNIISQARLTMKLNSFNQKKTFYRERIKEVNVEKEELISNQKSLEKFAREKYWMKKENEDLYIIIDKKN